MMCVAWVAELLRDPATGLNAIAGTENRIEGWPAVPAVEVFDETSTLWLSASVIPKQVLQQDGAVGVVVARMGNSESDALPYTAGYASMSVGVRTIARVKPGGTPRTDLAIISDQLMRNVERILQDSLKGYVAAQQQIIAGIEIAVPDSDNLITHHPIRSEIEGGVVMDLAVINLSGHDMHALGITPATSP